MLMGINLTNTAPINGYKLDKYDLSKWVIVDILFEINTYENHEYIFYFDKKKCWIDYDM